MTQTEQTHIPVVARSHPGMSGKNNEDRYAVSGLRVNRTPAVLAVLCDGIGGHRAGEVAAEMAVQTIIKRVAASAAAEPARGIVQAIQQASQEIYDHAQSDPARAGMGATAVVALVLGTQLYAATVGDSRLYLMRANGIRQLSTDHTWVQEAVDHGFLQPEQAKGHPNAHVIRRYLGSPTPPKVDVRLRVSGKESDAQAEANQGFQLHPGDRLLLCSDGLTDLVDNREILAAFHTYPAEQAVEALIALANQRGGHDNITLVALGIPFARRAWSAGCLGAVIGALLLAGAVVAGLWYFEGWPPLPGATPTPTPTLTSSVTLTPRGTARPSLTPRPTLGPEIFGTSLPRATATRAVILPPGGPTLTPWPTNTVLPSPTRTITRLP
jgi:protein phosphatase